jgi:phospholipid-binding lipoprotein MlaA
MQGFSLGGSIFIPRVTVLALVALGMLGCASTPPSEERPESRSIESAATPERRPSPLDGTGIEPNVVSYGDPEFSDPLMGLNRAVFAFNDVSYRYVLIPAARLYLNGTPPPLRTGIGNFFANIKSPISMVNHLLQARPQAAGNDLARFLINTTVGIGGIMDPAAQRFGMPRNETNTSQTLVRYGAGYGTYIVLPFIGSSTLRDGSAMFVDGFMNPLRFLLEEPESITVRVFDNFQQYSPAIDAYLTVRAESEDPYIFMRNLHLQGILRDAEYQ